MKVGDYSNALQILLRLETILAQTKTIKRKAIIKSPTQTNFQTISSIDQLEALTYNNIACTYLKYYSK